MKVTGGKKADGAVYLAFANRAEPSSFFNLLKRDSFMAFCSQTTRNLHVNLEYAMKNDVAIKCFSESREYISTAINILANKAVTFTEFPYRTYKEEQLPGLLKEYASLLKAGNALPEQMDVVKFIF